MATKDPLPSILTSRQIVEGLLDGVLITDAAGNIQFVNRAFCRVTGYSAHDVVGKNPRLLQSGRHSANFYRRMWSSVARTGHWQGEICNRRKNGTYYDERLSISALRNARGNVTHFLGVFSDISNRKKAEKVIRHIAYHDALTGLANRPLFQQHLKKAMARARRSKGRVGVLFLDLDHIKLVNDALGHSAGDLLLRQVAERLNSCVREVDTVSRFGGDEFVVLLPEVKNVTDVAVAGTKILTEMRKPFYVGKRPLRVTASIGGAACPKGGGQIDSLITSADTAMYNAKRMGRDRLHIFRPRDIGE
jgi:diguanylate cyclase (GGDEF)-like protein/PAS domain S-box-containing protein